MMWSRIPATGLLCAALASAPLSAQVGDSIARGVTPKGRFPASALHRLFLGDLNRDLWSLPFDAPYLSLDHFAGGLTPIRRGGGLQTRSLRLRGEDGVVYNFRSVDKDATRTLDPALRAALPAKVLQDQVGALFPTSAMVVAPLLKAANVLHPDPDLVVMPDDPGLGEFREEFAGLVGWIEVRPDEGPDGEPGFAGSTRVTGSARLLERLEETSLHQVDARGYLRARLMDVYVGDWDRHPDQWRWAAFPDGEKTLWLPIPRDRDWALARLDGLLVFAAGRIFPHYRGFGVEYPPVFNATFSGRALDRRILPLLTRDVFRDVASELQSALTDQVIAEAVARLPESYRRAVGSRLAHSLRVRRDRLPEVADSFYLMLASWVDLYGTDEANLVEVDHGEDGSLRVRLHALDNALSQNGPWVDRTFSPEETREVRIFLHGGDDETHVRGGRGSIRVRVVGGGGDDRYTDESRGRTHFYDHRGDNRFVLGRHTTVDERDWNEPPDQYSETHQSKARDWGSWGLPYPIVSFTSDVGLYLGAGIRFDTFGFRHYPYRSRLSARATVGPAVGRGRGALGVDLPGVLFADRTHFTATASSKEFRRFYGFGNDSEETFDDDFYKHTRDEALVAANLVFFAGENPRRTRSSATATLGIAASYVGPEDNAAERYVGTEVPYGSGVFRTVSAVGGATLGKLDDQVAPRAGWEVTGKASVTPPLMSATSTYGSAAIGARGYWSAENRLLRPVLGARIGGSRTWGHAPYHQTAMLGGPGSVLGHREGRFRGDATAFGNLMMSLELADFFFLLPGKFGVLGFLEAGRLWNDGVSPGEWHTGKGGGIWVSVLDDTTLLSFTGVSSSERTGLYLGLGWPF